MIGPRRMCEIVGTLLIAGVLYSACLEPVVAQNPTCPTRPTGDNSNACASTAFVNNEITSLTRTKLTANATYYARASGGSDTNCSGLANVADPGSGTIPRACAFATPQKAMDTVIYTLDLNTFSVTIDITGTFTSGVDCQAPQFGGGNITLTSTAGAAINTTAAHIFTIHNSCRLYILGNATALSLSSVTSGIAMLAYAGGYISTKGVNFGAAEEHMKAGWAGPDGKDAGGGTIDITGDYTISGTAGAHVHAPVEGALIHYANTAMTVTITGTPALSFFAGVSAGEIWLPATVSFSGSATGQRFIAHSGGKIIGPASLTSLPGNVAGLLTSGGVYVVSDTNSNLGVNTVSGTNQAAPSTPASGLTSGWFDTTDKRWHDKNDAGTIGTSVVADTGAANNFLTAISAAGVISKAQPSFSNISGQLDLTTQVTGTLPVGNGGTGRASLTANAFLTGNGTSGINQVAITGLVLGAGASAPAAYTGTSCTNQFPRSLSASGVATCNSVVGADMTNNTVGNAQLRQSAGFSVIGNSGSGTANVADLTGTAGQALRVNNGGTLLAFGQLDLSNTNTFGNTLPISLGGTGVASGGPGFNMTTAASGVNFNSGSTDTALTITLPSGYTRFVVNRCYIEHASGTLTTSTHGVFSATGGGGVAIQALTATTVSTASDATANNLQNTATGLTSTSFVAASLATANTIYFRVGTPQGSAATADVICYYIPLL